MGRMAATQSLGLILACASLALGQTAAPPQTSAASSSAAVDLGAPGELPPVLEASPLRNVGPVLAVPGMAVPGMAVPGGLPRTPRGARGPANELPPLVGPAEAFGANPGMPGWSGSPGSLPNTGAPSNTIRTTPSPTDTLDSLPSSTVGLDTPPRSTRPRTPNPPQAPQRPRLFGRWQPPAFLRARPTPSVDDVIAVEPRSDPAADAALKRRLEVQIRNAVGSRVRSFEVRVLDREVVIEAHGTRFWNRRSVKHTLETLPGLTGYHTTVELLD
jgi:hypothetical protein